MTNKERSEFQNPSAHFRGAPFWAWNCKLDQEMTLQQIDVFQEMGLGGFTIHCRTGLDTPYLGEEFLDQVSACIQKAKDLNMKCYLYDEDRWPSGFGGGEVTKNPAYRSRYLVFTPFMAESKGNRPTLISGGAVDRSSGDGMLLARYEVVLKDGYLHSYRRLAEEETGENVWYAYLEISKESPWFNNQAYVNSLDPKAIARFIETAYEKYFKIAGEEFGNVIPSIFTDEPQFVHKKTLGRAEEKREVIIPYTDDFEDSYQVAYGDSFLASLPEVFWELPDGKVSLTRYRYHDHLAERFATAFSDQLGDWCRSHGIALTGHMMEEPTLQSQTAALGETMRHYRGFDIPGIDMLCDWREYTTAKQAQSAAHQFGRNEITSELYGVTNWDFDFRGHKQQGDWQAALGVTHRVHHLSWMSMEGEAKRDYPASIFYQSPWYRKYSLIEDYFARINVILQLGKPDVRIGVIHPVESYWLYFGPDEQTAVMREQLEKQFAQVTEWLLFGLVDFDYISEALLENYNGTGGQLHFTVGEMAYDTVIVPGCVTLREHTVRRLKEFADKGGTIIFMGDVPKYVGAIPSDEPCQLAEVCHWIPFDYGMLMTELKSVRSVDLRDERGRRSDAYLYQMREDGKTKYLFLANGREDDNPDVPKPAKYTLRLQGTYEVVVLNPFTGEEREYPAIYIDGTTCTEHCLYDHDSLLLQLTPTKEKAVLSQPKDVIPDMLELAEVLREVNGYRMSEPNVLLLDQAEYSLDEGEFEAREEVLRIDNVIRKRLGYPLKMEAYAQPWTNGQKEIRAEHELTLKYFVVSEVEIEGAKLAIERPEDAEIRLNGELVETKVDGYYTDASIKTLKLPSIKSGENILTVKIPFHEKTNLEWSYLLGDFGVSVCGDRASLVCKREKIGFGDLSMQSFPFFAGNVTYEVELEVEAGEYVLEVTKFKAPLLSAQLDGKEIGAIAFSPYRLNLGNLSGRHKLELTAYGSRVNAFGPVHNCDESTTWFGPEAWRTTGAAYSYEYQLKRIGVLGAPKLYRVKK